MPSKLLHLSLEIKTDYVNGSDQEIFGKTLNVGPDTSDWAF